MADFDKRNRYQDSGQGINDLQTPNTLKSYALTDNDPFALPNPQNPQRYADASGYGAPTRYDGQYIQPQNAYPQTNGRQALQPVQNPGNYDLDQAANNLRMRLQQGAQQYINSNASQGDVYHAQRAAEVSRSHREIYRDQQQSLRNEQQLNRGQLRLDQGEYRFNQRQIRDNYGNQHRDIAVDEHGFRYEQRQITAGRRNRRDEVNTEYREDTVDMKSLRRNAKDGRGVIKDAISTINDFSELFGGGKHHRRRR